nr:hypothetical protein [Candidatus Sigynarchaeota archaeon]
MRGKVPLQALEENAAGIARIERSAGGEISEPVTASRGRYCPESGCHPV